MKKTLFSLAVAGLAWGSAQAKVEVGTIAPDFTLTDINGVSRHLYEYTDQGYTVIIDVSATWCGPCWNVHNSHVLKDLYNQYGPTGTVTPGKIMVLFIEGDNATTSAALHGTGSNTQGDWVTGEPFPIIDNASQNTNYLDGGFPTFTVICPNRRVAFFQAGASAPMLTTAFWTPFIGQCPSAVSGVNGATALVKTPAMVCNGGQTKLTAEIQNMGTAPLTAATVVAKVNGSAVATKNWTGNLAKYESALVEIGDYTFTQPSTDVSYEITAPSDALVSDNAKTQATTTKTSTYKTWVLTVKTDNYPGETSWKVKNSAGTVVQQHTYTAGTGQNGKGGPDAMKLFTHNLSLNANECYTVEVADAYGDGLNGVSAAADTGYIQLKDGVGLLYNFGGGFGKGKAAIVKSGDQGVGIEEVIVQGELKTYPNPVTDQLNIEMNLVKSTKVSFTFVNLLGQQIGAPVEKALGNGQNKVTLNTAALAPGVYVLSIATNKGSIQQKFVKK
ncbi:T9SS type A sorting domain-containing protein [Taibaiella helva]|uniref:T9SS type A sorting domain-containing protein n=1 Tax=Taibaiella helva TaxID=2301235 RepID=UPI000E585081|nr:T9SS type A sorting domain-containing protein [Taibaiella helva]